MKLNRNQIKYLAILAMLIDHLAWKMFDTASLVGQIMHFIGRLTGPTMAVMVAEGYIHTRNVKKVCTSPRALRTYILDSVLFV